MYFHDYDSTYDPAIPIVEISIGITHEQISTTILALVDSGADATTIPIHYLEQLDALPLENRWLRSATGERHRIRLYEVYLKIGNYGQYVLVVGDTFGGEAVVGRDILNHYVVKLDGLASVVEISP